MLELVILVYFLPKALPLGYVLLGFQPIPHSPLLPMVVIFASLSITQAKLGSAFAYRKNSTFLTPHS